jgi:hypothetical protein
LRIFPEDIELVPKLQKGEVEAFDLVYAKYAGKLFGLRLNSNLLNKDNAYSLLARVCYPCPASEKQKNWCIVCTLVALVPLLKFTI